MKQNDVLRLSLPLNLSYLHLALMAIGEAAQKIGFSGDDLYQIDLASEEAISNVMVHAFADQERKNFELICERAPWIGVWFFSSSYHFGIVGCGCVKVKRICDSLEPRDKDQEQE
jgi:hypothetical protein